MSPNLRAESLQMASGSIAQVCVRPEKTHSPRIVLFEGHPAIGLSGSVFWFQHWHKPY
jgi:hypothetical protein